MPKKSPPDNPNPKRGRGRPSKGVVKCAWTVFEKQIVEVERLATIAGVAPSVIARICLGFGIEELAQSELLPEIGEMVRAGKVVILPDP